MIRDRLSDLQFALRLADIANDICLRNFGLPTEPERKTDGSPVTAADVEIEREIHALVRAERPGDVCFGEELSDHTLGIQVDTPTWIIDPIDHTRHFVRGDPNYASLIALVADGITQVAIVSAPSLGMRWTAIRGGGAFENGVPIFVSKIEEIGSAYIALAGLREWINHHDWPSLSAFLNRFAYVRGTAGGFLPAMKVASGQLDVFIEPWGALWDHAALALIIEEAGGSVSTLGGKAATGGSLLATNGVLHDRLLDHFV